VFARVPVMLRARRLGLLSSNSWRRLIYASLACFFFMVIFALSTPYERMLLLPTLGLISIIVVSVFIREARPGIHTALRGFHLSLPTDGLAQIEKEDFARRGRISLHLLTWRILPSAALVGLGSLTDGRRWIVWSAVGLAMFVPAVLVSYRWAWTSPLLFLLVPVALGWQATRGYAALPPGSWTTPWSGALCSDRFELTEDGTA